MTSVGDGFAWAFRDPAWPGKLLVQGLILIIPIVALYEFFTQVVPKAAAEGRLTTASFAGLDSWMRWLPPGLAAHAIHDASDGHPGTAAFRLAVLAAVIGLLGHVPNSLQFNFH